VRDTACPSSLPVDGGGRDPFGVAGGERCSAHDIGTARRLADTAADERGERIGEHVERMDASKRTARVTPCRGACVPRR
jgi:hypothetical protein